MIDALDKKLLVRVAMNSKCCRINTVIIDARVMNLRCIFILPHHAVDDDSRESLSRISGGRACCADIRLHDVKLIAAPLSSQIPQH